MSYCKRCGEECSDKLYIQNKKTVDADCVCSDCWNKSLVKTEKFIKK